MKITQMLITIKQIFKQKIAKRITLPITKLTWRTIQNVSTKIVIITLLKTTTIKFSNFMNDKTNINNNENIQSIKELSNILP